MMLASCKNSEDSLKGTADGQIPQSDTSFASETTGEHLSFEQRIFRYDERKARTDDAAKTLENRSYCRNAVDDFIKEFVNKNIIGFDSYTISDFDFTVFEYDGISRIRVHCYVTTDTAQQHYLSFEFDTGSAMPINMQITCDDFTQLFPDAAGLAALTKKYADYVNIPTSNASYRFYGNSAERQVLCADSEYDIVVSASLELSTNLDDVLCLFVSKGGIDISSETMFPDAEGNCVGVVSDSQKDRVQIKEDYAPSVCMAELEKLAQCGAIPIIPKFGECKATVMGIFNVEFATENTIDQVYLIALTGSSCSVYTQLDANTGKLLYVSIEAANALPDFDTAAANYAEYLGIQLGDSRGEFSLDGYYIKLYQQDVSIMVGEDSAGKYVIRCTTKPIRNITDQ